jgi:biopolymer transport protein ExbD
MSRHQSEINVTPMLDVLLVLLIIFMGMIMKRSAIDVQLPIPENDTTNRSAPLVLTVAAGDRYSLNGESISAEQLPARLRAVFANRGAEPLYFAHEGRVSYDAMIHAMDLARGAGVKVLATAEPHR